MFEQDYLISMFVKFAEAIRLSMEKASGEERPAEAAEMIEGAIGAATDMDETVLLSLAPESIAGFLQVSGTDPQLAEYISRSLLLESRYFLEAGYAAKAETRESQAQAIADAFGFEIELEMLTEKEWEELFSEIPQEN